jgi:pyruvate dehydrogenase E2 component (dihydrolipoamide acetyltransferase)
MAKGKKQKPKKRVARRVDDELERDGIGEGADGADETNDELDDGDDGDDGHDGAEDADSDEAEPSEAPLAARATKSAADPADSVKKSPADPADSVEKSEPEPKARPSAKSKDAPTEMPVTQTSESGSVVFLAVIGLLLAFAIAVGVLTN